MRLVLSEPKKDFRLVALSNTDKVHSDFALHTLAILGLLGGWVVSYKERVAKPDPALYRAIRFGTALQTICLKMDMISVPCKNYCGTRMSTPRGFIHTS